MVDPFQQLHAELEKLNQAYRERLPEKLSTLEGGWAKVLQSSGQIDYLKDLHLKVHSLSGSGATYGLPVLSEASRKLELALKDLIQTDAADFKQKEAAIQILFDDLKIVALHPNESQVEPNQTNGKYETPPPAVIVPPEPTIRRRATDHLSLENLALSVPGVLSTVPEETKVAELNLNKKVDNRLIWLIEDGQETADSVGHQLGYFGYKVAYFNRLTQIQEADSPKLPAAIIFDLNKASEQLNESDENEQIQRLKQAEIPLVFISEFTDLETRLEAVRFGGKAYLIKPIKTLELIDILDKLTSSQMPDPYQILIIDDDPSLADYYGVTLHSAGMKTRVVNHPKDVLKALAEQGPDLILMDFHMPGCSGPELAAVIRQQQAYVSIPIVFLSAETDVNQQLAAMGQGGDDFLTKPIMPAHLISSITTRAQRSRVLREFMVRDSLTGLLNHTETKARLNLELAKAIRNSEPLTFAMVDIDHFKRVNDTFGHLAGDGVIKSISRLLRQRLRKTDTIGRYGGEEFAVILPSTNAVNAERILNGIRERFSFIRHQSDKIEFSATFSCGIASYPQYQAAIELNAAADQALYQAKGSGRNRLAIANPALTPLETN